ncbi:MAG: peptidylprolyl isomerase [Candidatus Dormibacteria bacterium]
MKRPVLFSVLLATLLGLAGCSLEDAPLVGKPAASMDGHTISSSDYKVRLKVEQDLYKKTRTDQQEQDIAIRSLVDEVLLDDEASKKGLSVSDDEVNKAIDFQRNAYNQAATSQRIQNPTGAAPPDFNTFLRNEGYDIDRLRESVKHILLEQKVEHRMAQNRADTAFRALQGGTPIADVARQYSDLASATTAGQESIDSAHLAAGDPLLQPALNVLQPGDISKSVVQGANGFYLFKLLTRDENGITAVIVFISAPQPNLYTPKFRPQWFSDFVKGLEDNAHVKYAVGSKAT